MHEIVTLQFGQRANYVATHFWNLQVGQVRAVTIDSGSHSSTPDMAQA